MSKKEVARYAFDPEMGLHALRGAALRRCTTRLPAATSDNNNESTDDAASGLS